MLGWPLKAFYESNDNLTEHQRETIEKIEDYEIYVGSIFTAWNPISHSEYWTDKNFINPTAKYCVIYKDNIGQCFPIQFEMKKELSAHLIQCQSVEHYRRIFASKPISFRIEHLCASRTNIVGIS